MAVGVWWVKKLRKIIIPMMLTWLLQKGLKFTVILQTIILTCCILLVTAQCNAWCKPEFISNIKSLHRFLFEGWMGNPYSCFFIQVLLRLWNTAFKIMFFLTLTKNPNVVFVSPPHFEYSKKSWTGGVTKRSWILNF